MKGKPLCLPVELVYHSGMDESVRIIPGNNAPLDGLRSSRQVKDWLLEWGRDIDHSKMILIGSAALLCQASRILGHEVELPENSMDVDVVTDDDKVAALGYASIIGSPFEKSHGFHVNLMPNEALLTLPQEWESRSSTEKYGGLSVVIPSIADILAAKMKVGRPRDYQQYAWAKELGLL